MPRESRAIVFDLDDTLYPYRWYVRSGFAAVAAHLQRARGLNPDRVFRVLVRASRGASRGRELQVGLETFRLATGTLPVLIGLMRGHQPRLRLPLPSTRVLAALKADGWRIGVLTNGHPPVQARKVAALGLARHVDTVVYAMQHGGGKPGPASFAEVGRRLDTPAHRIVMVGDDEVCDIAGALAAGMCALRADVWTGDRSPLTDVRAVRQLRDIPVLARTLLEEVSSRHAA